MPMPGAGFPGTFYMDFLASICKQRGVRKYLEIGVQAGVNLSNMQVDTAFGIDPGFALSRDPTVGKRALHLFRMSSDEFFAQESLSAIEMAFLDGMHLFEFLLRDIYNTEAVSLKSGVIFCHDCLPFAEIMVPRVPIEGAPWTGDVWKIVPILEKYRPDLKVSLIDCHPTGLVAISNLDPDSQILRSRYCDIVSEFVELSNDQEALEDFYASRKILRAEDILKNYSQSLLFRH